MLREKLYRSVSEWKWPVLVAAGIVSFIVGMNLVSHKDSGVQVSIRLQAIAITDETSYCMINGRVVTFDQEVDGVTVVKVYRDSVTVETSDLKQIVLTMDGE